MTDSRRELRRGLGWFGSATLLMRMLDVLSTVAILEYLSEEQLGVASLASSVSIVAETLSGLGVAGAIVQAKSVSEDEQSSLFWWCLGVAVVLGAATAMGSPWIANFYAQPGLTAMIAVSGLKFLTVGAAVVPLQMLTRELRFKQVGIVQTAATGGEALTKIALAAAGFGAWAIVLANVLRGLYLLIALSLTTRWCVRMHCRKGELKPFVRFGVRIAAASLVSETYRNIDYFLVGRYLGMGTLGVYRVAFDIAMTPVEAIAQPIYRVSYPLLARVAHDGQQVVAAFLRSSRYLLVLTCPVAVFLYFAGDDVLLVLGAERWLGAVPALGILCWAAVLRASTRLFSNLFTATGHPGLALLDAGVTLVVLTTSMVLALQLFDEQWGMLAVCYAWLLAYPLLFFVFWSLAKRVAPLRFADYFAEHRVVLVPLVLSVSAVAALNQVLSQELRALHPLVSMLSLGAVTLGAYFGVLWVLGVRLKSLGR